MSGARFDREQIVADSRSVAPTTKPVEHSMRPEAAGLYDPSLEKDSLSLIHI